MAEVIAVTLTSPTDLAACGTNATLSVLLENTDPTDHLENVSTVLTLPQGVSISSVSGAATAMGSGFSLDNGLAPGEMITIDVSLQADCDLITQAETITVSVSHDPVLGAMNNMLSVVSDPINLVAPELAITQSLPTTIIYSYTGFEFSVESTVENTTSAEIDAFVYCVQDNAVASLTSVTVAGNALAPAPSPAGQQCFAVTQTDIQNALGGAFTNASFSITENWEVVMCGNGGTLNRRAEFGCGTNDNCAADDFNDFPTTTIQPNVPDPVVSLSIDPVAGALLSLCGLFDGL